MIDRFQRAFRRHGALGAARLAVENVLALGDPRWVYPFRHRWFELQTRLFDLHHGVDTGGLIDPDVLGTPDAALSQGYEATSAEDFSAMMADTGEELSRYAFVDVGSGKGKTLLLASHHPFREVVGVELSEALHEIAEANIRRYRPRKRRCRSVRSVCADATVWRPGPGPTLVYLFNPFRGEVMRRFLTNLERFERPALVLYYQHVELEMFYRAPHLRPRQTKEEALARGWSFFDLQ